MKAIPLPTALPPRDPVADPWVGDVWQSGPRARKLLGFFRRDPCSPYRSYGRTLTHHYVRVGGLADASHVEIQRLLTTHALPVSQRPRSGGRKIGGIPWQRTSVSKIPLSDWTRWLAGATLIQHGADPDPPAPPQLVQRLGMLQEKTDGKRTTWTFEWGAIVREPDEDVPRWWQGSVLVGGIPVGTWGPMRHGDVLNICWGFAHGILVAIQQLGASDHAMIRLGLVSRKVVQPDFRRTP